MAKDRKKEVLLENLRASKGIISYACEAVKVSRRTYYNWYNEDEDFKEKADEILDYVIDLVESKLLSNISDGDTTAMIFFLKTKGKHRGYIEKSEVDVNVNHSLTEQTHFRVKSKSLEDAEMIQIEAK